MRSSIEQSTHLRRLIEEYYPYSTSRKLAEQLGVPLRLITDYAKKHKLTKSAEYYGSIINTTGERDSSGRFVKGGTPQNKGKRLTDAQKQKSARTWFKKGRVPTNAKYDGHERIDRDGYVWVRVAMGKYALKHRVVYEQHYGSIPAEHIVVFKDGNKQNIVPENLELITKSENLSRNNWHQYPELKPTMRALAKFNKAIANHGKEQVD